MRRLLEGGTYSSINVHSVVLIRERRLFETWHFLEEIRYLYNSIYNNTVSIKQTVWQTRFIFTLLIKHVGKNYISIKRVMFAYDYEKHKILPTLQEKVKLQW